VEANASPATQVATPATTIRQQLDRVEAAVAAGQTDLRALGFWLVVARIKRDPVLVHDHADQVGRIDTAAFRAAVRLRTRVWVGNAAMLAAVAVGVVAIVVAATTTGAVAGLAFLVAGGAWALGVHVPTHAFFGWLAGIRFTDAFVGGPPPPRPGLKTDYATYLRAEASLRAWFHASGAIATKIAPFLAIALWPATNAPWWAVVLMAVYAVFQIVTDILFSTKSSDWKRFARERAIARAAPAR
jgi:hypothetical protein